MFFSSEFKKRAVRRQTILLGSNVGIGDGAFPEARVGEEGSEGIVVLVGSSSEGFCGVFIGLLSDFPNLRRVSASNTAQQRRQRHTLWVNLSWRGRELKSSSSAIGMEACWRGIGGTGLGGGGVGVVGGGGGRRADSGEQFSLSLMSGFLKLATRLISLERERVCLR